MGQLVQSLEQLWSSTSKFPCSSPLKAMLPHPKDMPNLHRPMLHLPRAMLHLPRAMLNLPQAMPSNLRAILPHQQLMPSNQPQRLDTATKYQKCKQRDV